MLVLARVGIQFPQLTPAHNPLPRFQELWKVFWLLHVFMTNPTSFGATASSLLQPFSKSWYLCILHRSPRLAISRDQHDFTAVLDLAAFVSPSGAHFYSAEHCSFYSSFMSPQSCHD